MSIVVVTPTYNERGNIEEFVRRLFALHISDLSLVVVDDNSPDGTAAAVGDMGKRFPVWLISRPKKEGLGRAYAYAFQQLLASEHPPDIVVQMDADLSHAPEDLPRLLKQIATYDVVLGSRYIEGGRTENWSALRKCVSKAGNAYARLMLALPYSDVTGGFKVYRRTVLEQLPWNTIGAMGYYFQIETTYYAHRLGFRIAEVPITFYERKHGVSKFNVPIIMETCKKVFLLRWYGK